MEIRCPVGIGQRQAPVTGIVVNVNGRAARALYAQRKRVCLAEGAVKLINSMADLFADSPITAVPRVIADRGIAGRRLDWIKRPEAVVIPENAA